MDKEWVVEGEEATLFMREGRWGYNIKVPIPSEKMARYYEADAAEWLMRSIRKEILDMEATIDRLKE